MLPLISLISIFGYSLFLYLKLDKKASVSIFFSISLIIVSIFIFGMINLLKTGTYFIFYTGIITFFFLFFKDKDNSIKFITSIPIVLFTLTSIIYLYLTKDTQFFFYDEYTHWGVFIKEVFLSHQFYDANSLSIHLRYPPGITIWDYFILLPYNVYNEGTIFFAYYLILFSSVLMMYESLTWKQYPFIILIFVAQMVVFATYGHWFNSTYVDHIIGVLFAGMILSYFVDNYKNRQLLLFIFPVISIVLVKEIGLFFSLSFIVLIYVLTFYQIYTDNSIIKTFTKTKKVFIICITIFISAYLTLAIWNIRQDSLNVPKESQTISGISKAILSGKATLETKENELVSNRFWRVVLEQQLHKEEISLNYNEFSYAMLDKYKKRLKLSTLGSFIFFLIFIEMIRFTLKDEEEKKKLVLISTYLILSSFFYLIILYFSFLVAFKDHAPNIPSYVRYMNSAVLPLFMILIYFFLPAYSKNRKSIHLQTISFVLFLTIFIFITKPYISPFYSSFKSTYREYLNTQVPNIYTHIDSKSKLIIVLPIKETAIRTDVEQYKNTLRYLMIPIETKIIENNFLNKESLDKILKKYTNYNYIWILSINDELIDKNILEPKSSKKNYTIYKIEKNKTKLTPIY